jgi:hypothetical protein
MSVQFQGYDVSGMTEFVIPEGIKEIAPDAFKDCTRLKRVVIPQGVRKIGEQAFYGCEQLEEVVLPDGLEEIGKSAFCRCKSLKRLLLPDSVYIIDDSAFKSCEALNDIRFPENMYIIGKMAFAFCVSLKTVRLPGDVHNMHYTAFYRCDNLTEIVQSGTLIGDNHAFYEYGFSKSNLYTLLSVKELLPDPICKCDNSEDHKAEYSKRWVEFINTDEAPSIEQLTRVMIPRGIKEIATDAFVGCKNLTEVIVQEIGWGWYGLSDYIYPVTLQLPSSVRQISARAFQKCSFGKVIISESVEEIAPDAFFDSSVGEIIVHPDNPCYSSEDGMLFNKDKTILLAYPYVTEYWGAKYDTSLILPEGVEAISEYAFHDRQRFECIWLPSRCRCSTEWLQRFCHTIRYYTSEDGILYNIDKTVLLSCPEDKTGDVVVPDTVIQIGDVGFDGFYECSKLTSVKLPASIKRIVQWAFDGCTCVKEDQLPKDIEWIDYRYDDVELPDS